MIHSCNWIPYNLYQRQFRECLITQNKVCAVGLYLLKSILIVYSIIKKLCTHKKINVYRCFCSNSNWEDPKYLPTGEKINCSTLSKWNIIWLLKKRMHFMDTHHKVLVLSKRRYLTKCSKNWCTHEKWAWVFRDALFIIIHFHSKMERIHLCVILRKKTLQRQKSDQQLPGVGSEEGIDYNETGGHFSGGVTLTIW